MDHQNSLLSYNDYDYNTYEGLEKTMNGLRKGPWSEEEDSKLISSINIHGEGKWNTLAILAGNLIICFILFIKLIYSYLSF